MELWALRYIILFLATVPVDYLAQIFFGPIRILVPTAATWGIDVVDSKGGIGAFNSSFSVLFAVVLLFLLPTAPCAFRVIRVLGS